MKNTHQILFTKNWHAISSIVFPSKTETERCANRAYLDEKITKSREKGWQRVIQDLNHIIKILQPIVSRKGKIVNTFAKTTIK